MSQLSPEDINNFLNSPCQIWDNEREWKMWFADILMTLVREGDRFSAKRINCDSGWEWLLADGLSCLDSSIVLERDKDGIPIIVNWDAVNNTFAQICNCIFQIHPKDKQMG
jgi:hypothetical protein